MKVLHFYKTYYPSSFGGIEQVIFQLAEGCQRLGVKAEVLSVATGMSRHSQIIGSHLAHYAKQDLQLASTAFSREAIPMFRELSKDADIIHYHYPWPFMDLAHFCVRPAKPCILSYHSDIVRQRTLRHIYGPLMNRFLSAMDRIVAASPNYAASSPVLQRYADKVQIIPYGLDESSYPKPDDSTLKKWRTRIGGDFYLFVGVLRYYKGLHVLLDAMAGLELPLVIAGSGPAEAELRQKCARLGLRNVHLVGEVSEQDKAALLELSKALVFPSHLRSEAFGISLLEGAMYGKPLISCEIGTGTTFINIAGETGLTVPPADSAALRSAILRLWQDPALRATLGAGARKRFEQLFSSHQMSEKYFDLYCEALTNRKPHSRGL
ncbi:MAG: glycosyltransferase family 4 protein [Pseudomonadaceae bacterium]|nr:glycosyltransferase family 4 protein [Pseudomonadaceae bacterium]